MSVKIYTDFKQGSEQWFEKKYGKIGGSTSKGLFVKSDTLLLELLSCRLEPFDYDPDGFVSDSMQRGNDLEPLARQKLIEYTGINFIEIGWIESTEIPLIGISPDGITEDLTISCEIKCPSAKKHTENLLCPGIDSDYLHQCIHYFTVNPNLRRHFFLSFRPESKHPMCVRVMDRHTLVDLGTKAKPVIKTVQQWSDISRMEAERLAELIEEKLQELEF